MKTKTIEQELFELEIPELYQLLDMEHNEAIKELIEKYIRIKKENKNVFKY